MFYSHLLISLPFFYPVEINIMAPYRLGAVILLKVGYQAQVWAGMSIPSSFYLSSEMT